MSSLAPDPSAPNQMDARIRQIVYQVLSDPLSLPPEFVNWLTTFSALNATAVQGTPVTQSITPPTP